MNLRNILLLSDFSSSAESWTGQLPEHLISQAAVTIERLNCYTSIIWRNKRDWVVNLWVFHWFRIFSMLLFSATHESLDCFSEITNKKHRRHKALSEAAANKYVKSFLSPSLRVPVSLWLSTGWPRNYRKYIL